MSALSEEITGKKDFSLKEALQSLSALLEENAWVRKADKMTCRLANNTVPGSIVQLAGGLVDLAVSGALELPLTETSESL